MHPGQSSSQGCRHDPENDERVSNRFDHYIVASVFLLSDVSYGLVGIGQHFSDSALEMVDVFHRQAFGIFLIRCLREGTAPPDVPNTLWGQANAN